MMDFSININEATTDKVKEKLYMVTRFVPDEIESIASLKVDESITLADGTRVFRHE